MKESDFVNRYSTDWENLNAMTIKIESHGINKLSSTEVREFLRLFRSCSRNLAYIRTHYPESSIVNQLNSLLAKSHNMTYAVKKFNPSGVLQYIKKGFPEYLKEDRIFVILSFGIFLTGFLLSMILTMADTSNARYFLPEMMIKGVGNTNAGTANQWNYPLMSGQIMANNITVSLKAFVYGITLGIGTVYILFANGLILGSLTALIYAGGNPLVYWSLILPHGVIELTAIFISGAAGLILGYRMLIPGKYSRRHSFVCGAKQAVSLIFGVILMLAAAAVIEGFFTPLNIPAALKLIFASTTAVLLAAYIAVPYKVKNNKFQ